MPFSDFGEISEKVWTEIYEELFRPAIEDAGLNYVCERSQIRNGAFTKDIVQSLKDHYVVLADITHFNPNVMWELGVRHALSKRTIMVSSYEFIDTIPSDIQAYGVQPYQTKGLTEINSFKKKIKELLEGIEKDPERSDNPVFDFLKIEDSVLLSYERRQTRNKLIGLITELEENLEFANKLINGQNITNVKEVTSVRHYTVAMNQFLAENYVNASEGYLLLLLKARKFMYATNSRLEVATVSPIENHRREVYKTVLIDSNELKSDLPELIRLTKDLYKMTQSNSIDVKEPPIMITKETKEKYTKL